MATVLVISTDDVMQFSVGIILESAGHRVNVAEDNVGTHMISQGTINAVLLDLMTQDAEPLSSLAAVRTGVPGIPIVAIVGADQRLDFLEIRLRGADDVLKYPFTPRALLDAVERAIQEG